MKLCLILIFILSGTVLAQDLQESLQVIGIVESATLTENTNKQELRECGDGVGRDSKVSVFHTEDDVKLTFTFEINKISGLKTNPTKSKIAFNQDGFEDKFETMIQADNSTEREQAYKNICNGFSQEDAIAFAGYIGKKNSSVYDYDRVSGGSKTEDLVTIDDYFQVHRNIEGYGDYAGANKVGVCGDSARMIADFLKHCGFSCDDIDISSYRTGGSSGHQMVNARGKNGEYYSANWSEATVQTKTNPMQLNTPSPTNINGSAFVEVFDCNGQRKAKTTTPLGSLILMAHGDEYQLNNSQQYDEIKAVIEGLYVDEIVLKKFQAKDLGSGQSLNGFVGQINHQFGDTNTLLTFDTGTSILVGTASRDLSYDLIDSKGDLSQSIVSPRAYGKFNLKAIKKDNLTVSPYLEGDATAVFMKNTSDIYGIQSIANNGDILVNVGSGVEISGMTSDGKVSYAANSGVRGQFLRNVSQKGQMLKYNGDIKKRSIGIGINQVYARGSVMINSAKPSVFSVSYHSLYVLKQTQLSVDASKKFNNTKVSGNYFVLKNPGKDALHGFGVGVDQQLNLKSHSLNIGTGAQYVVIDGAKNQPIVNVSVIYQFKKR
ncbi:MAG: hypothetical protein ACI9QD_000261 [Thermoproteota archaeon]|jgi:hypothetical protein